MTTYPSRAHRAPRLAARVAAVLLLGACGRVETPVGASPDLATACDRLLQASNERDARCYGTMPEHELGATCLAIATLPGSALVPAALDECTARVRAARTCGMPGPTCLGRQSELLFPDHSQRGTLPPESACVASIQCAEGYCGGQSQAYFTQCATCRKPVALRAPCNERTDVCLPAWDEQPTCVEGTCSFAGGGDALGEACIDYGGGSCQPGLRCEAEGELNGLCVPRAEVGETCDRTRANVCAKSAYCDLDGRCAVQVVEPYPTESETCASCSSALACVDGECGPPVYRKEGEACGVESDCEPEDVCMKDCADDERCRRLCHRQQIGMACNQGSCENPWECRGFDPSTGNRGTCQPIQLGAADQACPCADGLTCVGTVCTPWAAVCPAP